MGRAEMLLWTIFVVVGLLCVLLVGGTGGSASGVIALVAAATVEQEALQVVLVGLLADHRADWCWCATVSLRITPFASFVL